MKNETSAEQTLRYTDSYLLHLNDELRKKQESTGKDLFDTISNLYSALSATGEVITSGYESISGRTRALMSDAQAEATNETDEQAWAAVSASARAAGIPLTEADEQAFLAARAADKVVMEAEDEIDEEIEETQGFLDRLIYGVDIELLAEQKGLEYQQNSTSDVVAEGIITLLAASLEQLFDRAINTFFEEE